MTTTEASRAGSVPSTGQSVKDLLTDALAGTRCRVHPMGLDVADGATVSDVGEVCGRLFRLGARLTAEVQFCLGDAYEHTSPYSARRRELLAMVGRALGPSYADRLRGFGSVARRWPRDRRSEKLPWQYYKDHSPGVPGKPDVEREHRPSPLKIVGRSVLPQGVLLTLEGYGARTYTVVYTAEGGAS